MSRRRGGLSAALRFGGKVAQQIAAAQRRDAAVQRRGATAVSRANREAERERRRLEVLERRQHLGNRQSQVDSLNADLAEQGEELSCLLRSSLTAIEPLAFE